MSLKRSCRKNPNLHSEFEDISSFTAESGKPKKSRKPVIAPKMRIILQRKLSALLMMLNLKQEK